MRNLIRAELVALRTVRTTWAFLALAVVMGVGIVVGDFSESGKATLDSFDEMRDALVRDAGLVTAIMFAVFGAIRTGAEYRYGTIAQRAAAAPRRWQLFAAKAGTYGALAAVTGVVVTLIGIPAAKAMASAKDTTFALDLGAVPGILGQVAAGAALFAALGIAVAFITRSQAAAVLVVVGSFVVEQILAGVGSIGSYLPYGLLDATFGMADRLAPGVGAAGLAAVTVVAAAAAAALLRQRDVV